MANNDDSIRIEDPTSNSELCEMARAGRLDEVRALLAAAERQDGASLQQALYLAASEGQTGACAALLDAGAAPDAGRPQDGATPLFAAAQQGHVGVCALLLGAGAEICAARSTDGATPILAAAGKNRLDVLKLLLAGRPDRVCAAVNQPSGSNLTPLVAAAISRSPELCQLLIEHGAALDASGAPDGSTALHMAAWLGASDVVDLLVRSGANVMRLDSNGATPAMVAAKFGHTDICLALLSAAATSGSVDDAARVATLCAAIDGSRAATCNAILEQSASGGKLSDGAAGCAFTPLYMAAQFARLDICSVLVAHGADVNLPGLQDGNTPLHAAAERGHLAVCALILSQPRADASPARPGDLVTPLCLAASNGHADVCHALLAAGAPVDAATDRGLTALTFAASKGHAATCEVLLGRGADPQHHSTKDRSTPLYCAAYNGHAPVCSVLLRAIGDKNHVNRKCSTHGVTALLIAAQHNHLEVCIMLLRAGADIGKPRTSDDFTPLIAAAFNGNTAVCRALIDATAPDKVRELVCRVTKHKRVTPLCAAAENGHAEVCRVLIDAGADPNAPGTPNRVTPLWLAATNGHAAACGALLCGPAGADVNLAGTRYGGVPLVAAIQSGRADVCAELLRAAGVDVNKRSLYGEIPIVSSAHASNPDIAEMLLAAGANPNVRDSAGRTPIFFALRAGHVRTAELLAMAGADLVDIASPVDICLITDHKPGNTLMDDRIAHFLPLRHWSPQVHAKFPAPFRRALLTVMLCATREESYIYGADRLVLFTICSFLHAFDF